MSAVTKKSLTGTPDGRRSLKDAPITSPSRSPARPPSTTTTSTPVTMANNVARNRSARVAALVAARGGTPRSGAGAGTTNINNGTAWSETEDDARAENVALIDDLKERLRKSEEISEQFQKQAQVLQSRLDDAIAEQGKLEERFHESDERLLKLENDKRDFLRQQRETEATYEVEKKLMAKEREESSNREEEMKVIIQRLKDSLNSRTNGIEEAHIPRRSSNSSSNLDNSQFVPPSNLDQSDSRTNSKLLLQKDRLIESLRLELAEAQIKLVESENMGGDRLQVAERELIQARKTNARLMEDNESYQLLLSERTLTGDFSKSEFMGSATHNADALSALEGRPRQPSLADELSEAGETQNPRGLAAELKLCKEQNKALTLYINRIIERLLQHQDFEAILDKSPGAKPGIIPTDRDLMHSPKEASGVSVLQRAKTVAMGNTRRPRPQSYMASSGHSVVTDQDTAPSIPIGVNRASSYRSGRPNSEQFGHSAANVVNQMYRSGHHSPSLHGPQASQSFFSPPLAGNPNAVHRAPSTGQVSTISNISGIRSESSSINSDSGEVNTPPSNSPPRSEKEKATTFAGNKPRQLRLLRDGNSDNSRRSEEETTTKSAKRTSWMGWAFGSKKEEGTEGIQSIQE